LRFLAGEYDAAVDTLSALAKEHPGSDWANDALEIAMMIEELGHESRGALDHYREALVASGIGSLAAAVDSLHALTARFEGSALVPRAVFLRAELETRLGSLRAAEEDLELIAKRFPLHELAPRALERLGMLLERDRPEEAAARYAVIIERYPGDPFFERVRNRYLALRRVLDGDREGAQER
jgi:TolA-binding protein